MDINFNNIAYTIVNMNGELAARDTLLFNGLRRALHFKKLAEDLQRRYPRSWRFIKWVEGIRTG